jgi:LacI family transcriptional regulator
MQRLAAYREFMLRSSIGVSAELIAQDEPTGEGSRRATGMLLDLADRPTAIYVTSRGMLDGVLEEMTSHGLTYPRDMSLATWGEPGTGEPAGDVRDVSYVAWDRQELGRMAILALEERIRAGRPERMVFRIAPRVVDRGSVATMSGIGITVPVGN